MPIVDLKTVKLNYEILGDPALPTVLLIMGLSMPASAWPDKFIEQLLVRGLRVITVDNRDAGLSEKFSNRKIQTSVPIAIGRALLRMPVPAPYRLEDMALDLAALLDYLNVPRVHAVGASMCGMIAQILAGIRPSRVCSLTSIMSASGNPRTGFGKLKAIYSILSQSLGDDSEQERKKRLTQVFMTLKSPHYQYQEEDLERQLADVAAHPLDPAAGERQLLAILASGDRSQQLSRITVPTLVIHGEDDPLLPLSAGKEVAELINGARFMSLPKMGHDLTPIHLETIADAIADLVWSSDC